MSLHIVVAGQLLATGTSGANRRLRALLQAMPSLLAADERITLLHGSEEPVSDPPAGVALHGVDLPIGPPWRRYIAERKQLPKLLTDLSAHVFDQAFLPLAGKLPCPSVLTIHDVRAADGLRRFMPSAVARVALRRSVRNARTVVVPSQFTERRMRAMVGAQPEIHVVPGAVDAAFLAAIPERPHPQAYFLHVGHLEARKDPLFLVAAYARFLEHYQTLDSEVASPPPHLVFIGRDQGKAGAVRERAAFLEIAGQVHVLGEIEESAMLGWYGNATAVLVPSRYEGFGLPALEGLATGSPVVVSNRGALSEVVGRFGTVLPSGDVEAWSHCMLDTTQRADDWGTQEERSQECSARREFAAQYRWEMAAGALLDVWRAAADE